MQYLVQAFDLWFHNYSQYGNLYSILSFCCWTCIILFISFVIQIIIHELGHGIAGILAGYELISIRIFHLMIIKIHEKWFIKRYRDPISYGQCLFAPPTIANKNKHSFAFMILGGCILNIITGILTLFLALSPYSIPFLIRMFFFLLFFYGIGFAAINGIPCPIFGLFNDGSNFYHMLHTKNTLESSHFQMNMIKQLIEGKTYGDIPLQKEQPIGKDMLDNPILSYQKILEYYHYLEVDDLEKAEQCLREFEGVKGRLPLFLKTMVEMEALFFEIYTYRRLEVIQELYTLTKNVIRKSRLDIHHLRVRMAYDLYQSTTGSSVKIRYQENLVDNSYLKQLTKVRNDMDKLKESYPYPGDVIFCEKLIERLKGKLL